MSQLPTATLSSRRRGRHLDSAKPRRCNLRKPYVRPPRNSPPSKKATKNEPPDSDIEEFSSPEVPFHGLVDKIPPLVESDEIETSPERAVEGGSDGDISEWSH